MITLAQAKASTIPSATGFKACSPEFTAYLNEAQERLAEAGRWWGSYRRMQVCAQNGCIVWPREVMTVEGLNVCNYGVPIRNAFYEFAENVVPPTAGCPCEAERILLDRGNTPIFRALTAASTIRLYPGDVSDVGKMVILQGYDANGIPIRTNIGTDASPNWINGEQVMLLEPFGVSVNQFAPGGLKAVQKAITNQRVLVFGWDGTTETPLATWEHDETNPSYRLTYLSAFPRQWEATSRACCYEGTSCFNDAQIPNVTGQITTDIVLGTDDGVAIGTDEGILIGVGQSSSPTSVSITCTGPRIEAIVRRQFIPARVDTDWLYIESLPAIKFAMMSILREQANEPDMAERFWRQAIRTLRHQLDAYVPPQRLVVNVEVEGTAPIERVMGGFI